MTMKEPEETKDVFEDAVIFIGAPPIWRDLNQDAGEAPEPDPSTSMGLRRCVPLSEETKRALSEPLIFIGASPLLFSKDREKQSEKPQNSSDTTSKSTPENSDDPKDPDEESDGTV